MDTEGLVILLASKLEEVEIETLGDTLAQIEAEALVDTLAERLAEDQVKKT